METEGRRRSRNVEVRRGGGGGRGGGGLGLGGLPLRGLGLKGIVIIGLVLAGVYFFAPASIKDLVFNQLLGGGGQSAMSGGGQAVARGECPADDAHCDFAAAVLASTEDVWAQQFAQGRLPVYGQAVTQYQEPHLVIFYDQAVQSGCGMAGADVGPFYCPADNQLYINPGFYEVMRTRLNAPGDFAQAYVIAHEAGHHIQNLIGSTRLREQGDQNQQSVRLELQADCFAGVWGHYAQADLNVTDADLREAVNAAHAIGDDTLQQGPQGYTNPASYTHGTSEQRMRWFRTGFDSGDARKCDTFSVRDYGAL